MDCWRCGKPGDAEKKKIGFREVCGFCGADLHSCKGCRYYAPGKPNDCAVPGTEPIRDHEAFNFCEEFRPRLKAPPDASQEQTRRRFGLEEPKKKDFGSLFKDDEDV